MGEPSNTDKLPPIYARLSVAATENDTGVRPPDFPHLGIWWLSPAIGFTDPEPLQIGEATWIRVEIRNLGNADVTAALLETTYNVWIGNEPEGMVSIGDVRLLPLLAGGSTHVEQVRWTPPDADSVHACVHARVWDVYSSTHHPQRTASWDSRINPQAGNRNVRLALADDDGEPVRVKFRAKNFSRRRRPFRVLVSEVDRFERTKDAAARTTLPFAPPRLWRRRDATHRGPLGGLTGEIAGRLMHERFGWTPEAGTKSAKGPGPSSLVDGELEPGEERDLELVLPPDLFPPSGGRRLFQVDYQVGTDLPAQHFVYLTTAIPRGADSRARPARGTARRRA